MNDQPQIHIEYTARFSPKHSFCSSLCSLKAQMPKTKHELNVGDLNKDVEKNSGVIISDPTAENT